MDLRHFVSLLLTSIWIAAPGCAWFSSKPRVSQASQTTPDRISMGGQGLGQPRSVDEPSGVSGAFKTVSNKVSDALTIKPKVIHAEDPISLSTKPKSIDPKMFILIARALEGQGQFDKAEQQYRKALEIDPNDYSALVGLGRLFDRQGRFDQAVKYYRQAIGHRPDEASGYNDLGLCLARMGDVQTATIALQEAVRLEPRKVLYRNNLAAMLVEGGQQSEALQQLIAVHKPAIAHYNLGYLLYKRDDHAAARRQFQLAVNSDPQLSPAQHMLDKLSGAPPADSQFQITDRAPAQATSDGGTPETGQVIRLPSAHFTPVSTGGIDAPIPTDFEYGATPQPLPRIE